ncbi:unnamed protein product [Periconia digitata]|uniref:Uncharacterized protein n=1 Tax=Periconia digitata TaxID=1303443 RepID=A0A9W4UKG5_9PLEO|nr:unnamed protein product [Periconia digitata]
MSRIREIRETAKQTNRTTKNLNKETCQINQPVSVFIYPSDISPSHCTSAFSSLISPLITQHPSIHRQSSPSSIISSYPQ